MPAYLGGRDHICDDLGFPLSVSTRSAGSTPWSHSFRKIFTSSHFFPRSFPLTFPFSPLFLFRAPRCPSISFPTSPTSWPSSPFAERQSSVSLMRSLCTLVGCPKRSIEPGGSIEAYGSCRDNVCSRSSRLSRARFDGVVTSMRGGSEVFDEAGRRRSWKISSMSVCVFPVWMDVSLLD